MYSTVTAQADTDDWVSHLGERSSIKMNEEHEFEHVTGDSAVVLPLASESDEELTLLVLPSRISEDKLKTNKEKHLLYQHSKKHCMQQF